MVAGLAFLSTAIATLFAEAALVRFTQRRTPHLLAWTLALAMFALASAALAIGVSTGWDRTIFRAFYLLGAILSVPWLALGSLYLVAGPTVARRVQWWLVLFSGFATGVLMTTSVAAVHGTAIPQGSDVLEALPRALAGVGSGLGAIVIVVAACWSGARYLHDRRAPHAGRLAAANGLIVLGTLVLSGGGLIQGAIGHDEAFTLSLALGTAVIYAGFLIAETKRPASGVPQRTQ